MRVVTAIAAFMAAFILLMPSSVSAQAVEEIAAGKILIANEALSDPNFDSAVVLIVGHGNLGTLGLILNRSLPDESDVPLYFGGPVKVADMRALAASRFTIPGAIHVKGELYFLDNQPAFEYLLEDPHAIRSTRFYSGISSWIPGQLQAEVRAGAWYVRDSTEEIVFSDNKSLWEALITEIHAKWVKGSRGKNSLPDDLHPTYNATGIKRVAGNEIMSAIK